MLSIHKKWAENNLCLSWILIRGKVISLFSIRSILWLQFVVLQLFISWLIVLGNRKVNPMICIIRALLQTGQPYWHHYGSQVMGSRITCSFWWEICHVIYHILLLKKLCHMYAIYSHVSNGTNPCINKAIHVLLMHGFGVLRISILGPS